MTRIAFGITDHVEGPHDRPSAEVFAEVGELVRLADRLGVEYAWFAEHHAHAHAGHLPSPLLMALHLAGQTRRIRLGTAVLCLNLHQALGVAEAVAVADVLTGGRMAVGFGSGSTPEEFALHGLPVTDDRERHERFEDALKTILAAWSGLGLPRPAADLPIRSWLAVNSVASARIAGRLGFNILFSHLRTPEQYAEYRAAYRASGGAGRAAANRPIFVGPDDRSSFEIVGPALRTLWRRFRSEGKIPEETPEPDPPEELCGHPINFVVGGPESVARQLLELHRRVPFEVANLEVRWDGLPHSEMLEGLRRLMEEVRPIVEDGLGPPRVPSPISTESDESFGLAGRGDLG